jgi:hypothetical protein
MTKFSYNVSIKADGAHITVTRLADKAKKEFFQAGVQENGRESLVSFMNSITDELADGYWPRPRKEKK